MDTPFIIVTGNPIDGVSFIGPFDDDEIAEREASNLDVDWWIAPLIPAEES
jgi:hypothetical protein